MTEFRQGSEMRHRFVDAVFPRDLGARREVPLLKIQDLRPKTQDPRPSIQDTRIVRRQGLSCSGLAVLGTGSMTRCGIV